MSPGSDSAVVFGGERSTVGGSVPVHVKKTDHIQFLHQYYIRTYLYDDVHK